MTRDEDLGLRKILDSFEFLGGAEVSTGIQGPEALEDRDGLTLVGIAAANEFGTERPDGGSIPARPAFREAFDQNEEQLEAMQKKIVAAASRGDSPAELHGMLDKLGAVHKAQIQKRIVDLRDPPNAPSTIERKSRNSAGTKDNPLIEHGVLRGKVSWITKTK